jgi:glycosyltransferase involved in cell wall biosynthesis
MLQKLLLTCSDANSLRNFRGRLIASLRDNGHEVIAVAPSFPPAIARWCSELGVEMERTSLDNQSLNPFRDVGVIGELYRIIRRRRPDVVMGYTHKPALYTAFAAKLAGVPRVTMMVTGIGFGFEPGAGIACKLVPAITRTLFRVGCAVSRTVIFHNKDNRDFFVAEKLLRRASKAVVVGGSGVDLSHFTPQPLTAAPSGELTFLLIARIVRYKGILEYARAAEALRVRYPKARFLLAGYHDANPLAYSEDEWRFIQDQVEYLGPSDDVRSLYAKAHVYVLPSYGEGMPRTVLEAMASGRPIITSDTYGCRDTVKEQVNGFLVPTRRWEPLADAMEKFLGGRCSIDEMGAASLARVKRMFDVEKVNEDMVRALGLAATSLRDILATEAIAECSFAEKAKGRSFRRNLRRDVR